MEQISVHGVTYSTLCSKSILMCSINEEIDKNNREKESILNALCYNPLYQNLVVKYEIKNRQVNGAKYEVLSSEEFPEFIECFDIKNGGDFYYDMQGDLNLVLYGQLHSKCNQYCEKQTNIAIRSLPGELKDTDDPTVVWEKSEAIRVCENAKKLRR